MPTLIIQQIDGQVGCRLDRRLLIGRRLTNDIIINDVAVSRIHAWIDGEGETFYIADNSSRTGVRHNGRPVAGRQLLADGDQIEIGPARLTFWLKDQLPDGISLLPHREPTEADGTLFNCACGAPLWVGSDHVRSRGRCRHCGRSVSIPQLAGAGESVLSSAGQAVCSICQCLILAGEQTTGCPSCQLVFHADCWTENRGCSAYGCDQVNVLSRPEEETGQVIQPADIQPAPSPHWPLLLLAASLFAAVIGLFTFGLTALAAGLIDGVVLVRFHHHRRLTAVALAVCLVGMVLGLMFSFSFWLHRPLWSVR